MTQEQLKKLPHGLYRIFWKDGGSSLASVGSIHNGDRWMAPCNWTSADYGNPKVATCESWRRVERVEVILAATNYGAPDTESL